jgi:hypothetical protein
MIYSVLKTLEETIRYVFHQHRARDLFAAGTRISALNLVNLKYHKSNLFEISLNPILF